MTTPNTKGATYRDAGVDIEAGDALVDAIKPLARATRRAGVLGGLGGFGALFDLKAAGFTDPILVSTTDGVGTKLKIAIETGIHETVGIDLETHPDPRRACHHRRNAAQFEARQRTTVGNEFALDEGIGMCGKAGQGVPVGVDGGSKAAGQSALPATTRCRRRRGWGSR